MLGDLNANLDRPDVTGAVLATMDPIVVTRSEQRSAAAAMVGRFRHRAGSRTSRIGRMMNTGHSRSQLCARQKIQASPRSDEYWDGSLLVHNVPTAIGRSDRGCHQ
jgi:hypothetical protein